MFNNSITSGLQAYHIGVDCLDEKIHYLIYTYTLPHYPALPTKYESPSRRKAPSMFPRSVWNHFLSIISIKHTWHVPRGRTWTCQTAIFRELGRAGPWAWRAGPRTGRKRPATRADSYTGAEACGPDTRRCRRARCRRSSPRWPGTARSQWWTLPAPCTLMTARRRWSLRSSATTTLSRCARTLRPWRWRRPFKRHPGTPART